MGDSLQERLAAESERMRDDRSLGFMNGKGEVDWRTGEQFFKQVSGCAERLQMTGLRQGDVCVLVLPSGEFCATAVTATLQLGAVPLLIAPPTLFGTRLNLFEILIDTIRKTEARVVVSDGSMVGMREQLENARLSSGLLFEEDATATGTGSLSWARPADDDIAAMQLTSGTTGFPRICVWKQKSVLAALDGMVKALRLENGDTCFNWTPLYHDMGLVNNFLLCLTNGVPLVMLSPHDFVKKPALWLRGLSETGSTITWSPNFGYAITAKMVKDKDLEGVRLDGVRAFWNAAERIHLETVRRFYERFADHGVRWESLKMNFGCAENVGGATFTDADRSLVYERVDSARLHRELVAAPLAETDDDTPAVSVVSAGRPAPGMEVFVLSETGVPLPDGHIGEVALKTPSRMLGYLNDPDETGHAIFGDYLRTGDLGYVRDQELFWVGRVRERITVRGKKLDPSDFEPILFKISGLRPGCFAAFGVDDEELGTQRLVIVSEVTDSADRDLEAIRREVRSATMLDLGIEAKDVILVPKGTLSKTSSGKRRHRYFRELYSDGALQELDLQLQETQRSLDE